MEKNIKLNTQKTPIFRRYKIWETWNVTLL